MLFVWCQSRNEIISLFSKMMFFWLIMCISKPKSITIFISILKHLTFWKFILISYFSIKWTWNILCRYCLYFSFSSFSCAHFMFWWDILSRIIRIMFKFVFANFNWFLFLYFFFWFLNMSLIDLLFLWFN
jgi:hypothetical protein